MIESKPVLDMTIGFKMEMESEKQIQANKSSELREGRFWEGASARGVRRKLKA